MKKPTVLLADDDKDILQTIKFFLSNSYDVKIASSVAEAKAQLQKYQIDAAVIDLNFEGQDDDGINLIDFIQEEMPSVSMIVLSSDHNTKRVVEATRRPLVDFITKDEYAQAAIRQALSQVLSNKEKVKSNNSFEFKTQSPLVKKLLVKVDQVLASNSGAPILILGESGTGKEFLAKYISSKVNKKLVAANMASIPKETAESELFGHCKGAFTGAVADKIGLLEQAHNGIFFLDEIGDCSPAIQAKLLRAIQEKEIMPVGGTVPRKVEVRFIAATHRDLAQMISVDEFRLDLHQRLNTFTFKMPPLRERPEDVEYYARIFVNDFKGGEQFRIEKSGLDMLKNHNWEGNVRELWNVIQRVVVFSKRKSLDQESALQAISSKDLTEPEIFEEKEYGKQQIIDALKNANGNRMKAAEILKTHITTLHKKINKFGLRDIIGHKNAGRPVCSIDTETLWH